MPGPTHASPPSRADRIEFAVVRELPGVEVLRVDAPTRWWRWYHETYTVATLLAPMRAEWKYRGRVYLAEVGAVSLMEPGELHANVRNLDPRESARALFLAPALLDAAARELGIVGAVHWRGAQFPRPDVVHEIVRLHAALETETTALEREARFVALLERLLTEFPDRPARPPRAWTPAAVRRARELLADRWADNVSLDELAAASGVGRFHLVHAFHAALGLPPHAYQICIRVARARALIRQGVALARVAVETGFTDQSHLARHFTRVMGVSPGRYRLAVR